MKPIKILSIGAGSRGTTYATYALEHPDQATVVGVAEPRAFNRDRLVTDHKIDQEHVFSDWREAAALPKFADVAIITTQDAHHAEPAIAFAELGYNIVLEKPIAPTEAECRRVVEAIERTGRLFAVCHVYRYVKETQRLKEIIDSGVIGDVVNIQHFEPVGYWHQAHSFVRGNWRNEEESSFMLLAKSCHDMDLLQYVMGDRCVAVSSFGTLKHFRRENKPAGGANRCLDCNVESECPYSAPKLYFGWMRDGKKGWPVDVLTPNETVEGVTEALRTGPYGRCVYECDNDVVDNQVVALQYASGQTATFTMTAFNNVGGRKTRIFGTRGELYLNAGDREFVNGEWVVTEPLLRHFDFLTEKITYETISDHAETALEGHHYGDYRMMQRVVQAMREERQDLILSGPQDTLLSHLTVFAAERSRREGRVVSIEQ